MSAAQYYCSPPFHDKPPSQAKFPDLPHMLSVMSPHAKDPGRGKMGNSSAGCDAGEHEHEGNPVHSLTQPHLATPVKAQSPPSSTKHCSPYLHAWSTQHTIPSQAAPSTLSTLSLYQAAPTRPPAPTVCYAVGGGPIVCSDLTLALTQFTVASPRGPAELLTMEDARQATYFTSGFSHTEAALISQAEHASDMWLGQDTSIGPTSLIIDMAWCRCRRGIGPGGRPEW
ncbi:hypothetical protein B0H14DRAFT_2619150 [Mycena olivaceomarginata]|nr:hypothetical protein B0H14DRAFT_2619150 [Mycena olivaceomarginata]